MTEPTFQFGWLNDSRLAAHALSPTPVWLWSVETQHILWANPVAAAIFDAPSPQAAARIDFGPQHTAAVQIARLASTLPQAGAPRLERLRGFGATLGGTLICLCSKITLADNSAYNGGGLANAACGCGNVSIYDTTITGNDATQFGGGIYNANGAVTLANSIVAGNGAGYQGPDIAGIGTTNYTGVNLFSQAGVGRAGTDVYVSP